MDRNGNFIAVSFADPVITSGTNYLRIYDTSGLVLVSSTIHTLERVTNCDINDSGFCIVGAYASDSGSHLAEVYDINGNVVFSHTISGTGATATVRASKTSNFVFGIATGSLPG